MSPKKKATEDAAEDRRAEDQDAAVEEAFVAGVLPEEDRRDTTAEDTLAALTAAGVGTTFTKTRTGWQGQYVGEGGVVRHVSGPTIPAALHLHETLRA